MIREIIFKREAELDFGEAYQWYEERDRGLGTELKRAIDACLSRIQRHPELYPVVHSNNVRQGMIRRFPYSILYLADEETIYVIAVFHASRDPQIWKDRG